MPDEPHENPPPSLPPFALEHRRLDPRPDGGFTPDAAVLVTPALRASGLLGSLDAEDLQALLLALSCVTPNGGFALTPELAGAALGIGAEAALARLRRLASSVWRDGPLLVEQRAESGLRLFTPAAHLFEVRNSDVAPPGGLARPAAVLESRRAAVIAHSRAAYSRPRAEVEAEIERFLLGEEEPGTPEAAARLALRRRLLGAGLTREQADRLLDLYPPEEVELQLGWLPYRHARNPAGYLIAAVEGGYEAPPALRQNGGAVHSVSTEPHQEEAAAGAAGAPAGVAQAPADAAEAALRKPEPPAEPGGELDLPLP